MLLHFIFVIKDKELGLRDAEFQYVRRMAQFFKSWVKTKFSLDFDIQCDEMITKPRIILQRLDTHSLLKDCLLYTSPSPRDLSTSRMPSSA